MLKEGEKFQVGQMIIQGNRIYASSSTFNLVVLFFLGFRAGDWGSQFSGAVSC